MADITNPEMIGLENQRAMAQALLKRGMQTPESQMVSGRFVGASPLQYLGNLFNQYVGQKGLESVDAQQLALAEKLRQQGATEVGDILTLAQGRPELPSQELAGPSYQGVAPSIQYPAVAGDTQAALAKALTGVSPQAQALAPSLLQNLLPKKTDKLIEYDTYKKEGGKKSFSDWSREITPEQEARLAIDRQRLGLEGERLSLEKQKAQQELMFGKPLPESATKQVTGATNLQSAIKNYQDKLKGFSTFDFANPNARAEMGNAYNNMMLQAKEAYNLGVLNGPDYAILTSIVKDPTSPSALLVSKNVLNKQAEDLSKNASSIIENVYKTHNRPNPQANQTKVESPKIDPALLQYMTPEQRKLFGG